MSIHLALVLALLGLAVTLAVAVVRPTWLPEPVAAVVAAAGLVVFGAVSIDRTRQALGDLAPTIGFLAALLLIGDGCRREGLFDALGTLMARRANASPRRLLALVFILAAGVTAVISLDSTIVLLTPVVFATVTRLRMTPTPYVYACDHLANSASLLLPVSNLTNLLAFRASGLTFAHFSLLMALPTLGAIAIEWVVLTRFFGAELRRQRERVTVSDQVKLPRFALAVVGVTLIGFLVSSLIGVDLLWIAAAGAAALTVPALVRRKTTVPGILQALQPGFLIFVFGLGIIVAAASDNGLTPAVRSVLPLGESFTYLLGIAAVSAVLANLVNNLPATLILAPALAPAGHVAVLAALLGVNIGPNLTYVGSLATLLWRRILRAEGTEVNLGEFLRLGALTVPAALVVSAALLWAVTRLGA
jgi:arsenical pump membrane protein